MEHILSKHDKRLHKTPYRHLIGRLPDQSKKMLNLINDYPGINAKAIQQELKLESKRTKIPLRTENSFNIDQLF